jgi:hypothetical protein
MMSKRRAAVWAVVLGLSSSATACVAYVDDSETEEVDSSENALDVRFERPRIRRPNPMDPGRRLLFCLPDPRRSYVSRDPDQCAAIRFFCAEGEAFFDRCGCGCFVGRAP